MPAPKKKQHPAEALIDMIIARAPALHAAGVTALELDGVSVTLAPPPPPDDEPLPPPPATQHIDPMQDPSTFPGGRIPGYQRELGGDS